MSQLVSRYITVYRQWHQQDQDPDSGLLDELDHLWYDMSERECDEVERQLLTDRDRERLEQYKRDHLRG